MKKAKIAKNVFFILGALALGIMVYSIGLGNIWRDMKQTGWWYVPIIGMWLIVYMINALSLYIILRDGSKETKKIGFFRLLKLTISGFAINYITPFGLMGGEPYKIIELQSELGLQKSTSSVLLSTMMHFVAHFIFWMVSIPLLFFLVPVISDSVEIGIIISTGTTFLLLLWAYRVYTRGGVNRALIISSRLPFIGKKIKEYRNGNQEKINQMDELISDLYKNRKRDFFFSLSLEFFARILICVEVILMMQAINRPITFGDSVLIESLQSLISNLFFFYAYANGCPRRGFCNCLWHTFNTTCIWSICKPLQTYP